ncbi:MAG: protein translocase subunit SecD [Thermoleophilia bacterium]|nr:protein translocase subunit SecD [Thermoleophilia bacterium]
MNTGRRALLLLLVVIGLTAASLVAIALKPATLGLDLQGGVEVVLEGRQTSAEQPVDSAAMNRAVEVIRSRVDAFGVAEPEIQTAGSNQIVVALPGADDPDRVVNDLIKPAQLFFYDFTDNVVDDTPNPDLYKTVLQAQKTKIQDTSQGSQTLYAFTKDTHRLVAGPVVVGVEAGARETAIQDLRELVRAEGTTLAKVDVEAVPKGLTIVRKVQELETRASGGRNTYFIFQDRPGVTGKDIRSADSIRDVGQGRTGEPIVTMEFTGSGSDKFHDITRDLAQRGAVQNTLFSFAIVLDGELISNPTIDPQDLPDGIGGGRAQIEGNFTAESARTLADQINSGAIPVRLEVVSQKQVSATLGKESLRSGLIAGVAGLLLVVAFMIVYYRLLGLVATLGLLIYAALFYAAVVLVPITLTLPGIAGVILTIGVASDANVVIFERVREEARSGKSSAAALSAGYRKGLAAIIDANVVTFFTAIIVFLFATAGPRGFAFTLGIGVLLSLLTAVFATRAIFGVLVGTRFMRDEKALALNQGHVFSVDWVGKWRLWLVLSTIPVLFGLGWLGVQGLNLGLDFESGTRIAITYDRPTTENGIRDVLAAEGVNDAKIQATTEKVEGRDVAGFQIQTKSLEPDVQQKILRDLDTRFGAEVSSLDQVGPTFGKQIIRNAIYAVIISFIIVALYLVIRFEYKLALPAMLSVIHDVALCIGVYAVLGKEVTSATVAALLTILGYSLYDVVIVFDRIRENVPLMRGKRYRDIVNLSVNEVFTRSLITSLTTLLPVLALYFFGGDTLHDFSFALLVGILAGGVSSIVIAAPLAAFWKERDPDEQRRAAKIERKRQRMIASDSDVVDLAVLERAESALDDVPLDQNAGLIGEGSASIPPEESVDPRPVELPAGAPAAVVTDEDEADYEPLDASPPGDGQDGADEAAAQQGRRIDRERPDPERQRRHQQVRRRKRR